ncbi:cysteine synthase family protein [Planktothrix sp. FACHB-1355]|uniref:PLP-dependent cysteine synthase family protein n=1 Tax=Planktothrix sp. FACHB-1355 TaxID=2692854 RepID=UPI00168BF408|nr:cysteine synthase family protein [Planktothrix sp. FACHB-1355]MBD3557338.1 cysteine synthase family protein [Planktothrix sp. FACHB-1355]
MKYEQQKQVGNTPFVPLRGFQQTGAAEVWGKCEYLNPTGTPKDRLYTYIIEKLEESGQIQPGMTLVDASTGNGGGALARAANLKGYKSVIIMPEGMTQERKNVIKSWHGQIIESPAEEFLLGAERVALGFVEENPEARYLNQAGTQMNWQSMRSIGREVVEEFKKSGIKPQAFVCSIGTGGTYTGVATELENAFPGLLKIGIEVDKSAPLFSKRNARPFEHRHHNLMGLGPGKIGGNLNENMVDEVVTVSGDEAWQMMKKLVKKGYQTGPTSGANVLVALKYARRFGASGKIATVLFDASWKYISIWDGRYQHYQDASLPSEPPTAKVIV